MLVATPRKGEDFPTGLEWVHEPKLNGYRMLGRIGLEKTVLRTRQGNNFADRVPTIVGQLPFSLAGHTAVVDGEMVGVDSQNHENFNELSKKLPRAIYYIFDLLELDGKPLISRPLRERRRLLDGIFVEQDLAKVVKPYYQPQQAALWESAQELGLEGLVAKRLGSLYYPGRRSPDWVKHRFIKHQRFPRTSPRK
jgi:bifunctional non-homologous end joining protein LigD